MKPLSSKTHPYLGDLELAAEFQGSPDSRYGKIKRLLAEGKLVHLRRGLYYRPDSAGRTPLPHPFEAAQFIYGPSYISLESALSFHQLIPEAVYTITCVTTKRSKVFSTPFGRYEYCHCPLPFFLTQVMHIKNNDTQFLIATPWKAIGDMMFCNKKKWLRFSEFCDSLRITIEALPPLTDIIIDELTHYYQNRRVSLFLQRAQRELKQLNDQTSGKTP